MKEKLNVILVGEGEAGRLAAERLAPFCSLTWLQWKEKGAAVAEEEASGEEKRLETGKVSGKSDYAVIDSLCLLSGRSGEFEVIAETTGGERKKAKGDAVVIALAPQRMLPDYWCEQQGKGLPVLSLFQLEEKLKRSAEEAIPPFSRLAFVLGKGGWEDAASTRQALRLAAKLISDFSCQIAIFYQQLSIGRDNNEEILEDLKRQGAMLVRYRSSLQVRKVEGGRVQLQAADAGLPDFCQVEMEADFIAVAEDRFPSCRREAVLRAAEVGGISSFALQRGEIFYCGNGETPQRGIFWVESWPEIEESTSTVIENICAYVKTRGKSRDILNATAKTGKSFCVDSLRCSLCLTCFRVCPHGAIYLKEAPERRQEGMLYSYAASIKRESCWGCGICRAECPAAAIQALEKEEFVSASEAGASEEEIRFLWRDKEARNRQKIVILGCRHSGYLVGQKLAERSQAVLQREKIKPEAGSCEEEKLDATGVEIILKPVDCTGSIDRLRILSELEGGADGVLIWACHYEACQHLWGNQRAEKRASTLLPFLKWTGRQGNIIAVMGLAAQDLWRAEQSIKRLLAELDAAREGKTSDYSAEKTAGRN